MLLIDTVATHIIQQLGQALAQALDVVRDGETMVQYRYLSEVSSLTMREPFSLEVGKCIYPRLPYPSQSGTLERDFIQWVDNDSTIEAFCKINEHKHDFLRLRYLRDDGLPAFYYPDFITRAKDAIYMVETKAAGQINHPNVQRKKRAAINWCADINRLQPEQRFGREWHYALLSETIFYDWRDKGARMADLFEFCRLRESAGTTGQVALL